MNSFFTRNVIRGDLAGKGVPAFEQYLIADDLGFDGLVRSLGERGLLGNKLWRLSKHKGRKEHDLHTRFDSARMTDHPLKDDNRRVIHQLVRDLQSVDSTSS